MNAITNLMPQAIEWPRPIINNPLFAIKDLGHRLELARSLLSDTVSDIGQELVPSLLDDRELGQQVNTAFLHLRIVEELLAGMAAAVHAIIEAKCQPGSAPSSSVGRHVDALQRHDWDAKFAEFVEALRQEDAYRGEVWLPADMRETALEERLGIAGNPAAGEGRRRMREAYPDEVVPEEVGDEMDRLVDVRCDRRDELILLAAPDLKALRWKLDVLLEDDGTDTTPSWVTSFIAQTRADYRRLLGGED